MLHSDQYFVRAQWDALLMQLYATFHPPGIIVWSESTLIFEKYATQHCLLYDTDAFSFCQKTTHGMILYQMYLHTKYYITPSNLEIDAENTNDPMSDLYAP